MRKIAVASAIALLSAALSASSAPATSSIEEAAGFYEKGSAFYEKGDFKNANKYFTRAMEAARESKGEDAARADKPILNKIFNLPTRTWQERQIDGAFESVRQSKRHMPEYLVGDGDILAVSIWQNPDLTQDAIVRPDGRISFPLIGDVMVAGKTLPDIDDEVTEKLRDYIKFPEVSIYVKALGGGKVIVLGEVRQPGVYYVTGRKTVLEALALAQGLTDTSLASTIIVVKSVFSGSPRVVRISANMALNGSAINNIMLESDDVVFVPKKPVSDAKWFLDNVWDPFIGEVTTLKAFMKMDK